MSKKNKLMLAAAIVAVVLLVGSGVARCSLSSGNSESADSNSQAVSTEEDGGQTTQTDASQSNEDAEGEAGEKSDFSSLVGSTWVAAQDTETTLTIVKGAFVESKDGQSNVIYWTIDSEEEAADGITATLLTSTSATGDVSPGVCTVRFANGRTELSCDALADTYVRTQTNQNALEFSNITDDLAGSFGADSSLIQEAVSARAAVLSPQATRATWDAEVWCDFKNDTATTTFTLDDAAQTMISVTRRSDNTIEAL